MADDRIRLIVGLGNPGPQYELTRHNVGFWLADRLAAQEGCAFRADSKLHGTLCRLTLSGRDVRVLKPSTFMNRSGQSVAATARYFSIAPEEILIAHDELDLPPGSVRLKQGGGHAGHNGLRDTIQQLGSRDFWRLRIGIGHPGDKSQVVGYVLNRPTRDEGALIVDAVDEAERSLAEIVTGGFQRAMNRLHGPAR
ncbi:peptidyl-tRNA hydrolase [Thioflavicoccus mobilis 8321]|uniref:Peptidyl-tRNA hydrolase n=1 Tax=Thioflavicoccus mobilis 8321 TaxID=765912 RepID=L0H2K2_9GAMM|nr:aminoacyl-tRNA hydrolase [Thioflavicoccus mobilis]AGA91819.1 peptidyl-tRNA hydrolase [Thioflavicoccus mobilis 8321]